jgi:hypothetical protein
MLYTAKCYWPGVTAGELEQAAERALEAIARVPSRSRPTYRGSLLFAGDDLVLCLFEASSRVAVKRASDQAGMPCERVMDTVWLAPDGGDAATACAARTHVDTSPAADIHRGE